MTKSEKRFLWRVSAILMGILIWMAITPPAGAGEPEQFTHEAYRRDLYWRGYYCRDGRYHAEGCDAWRWRRQHRHYHQPVNPDSVVCHAMVPAVGEQAQSEEAAWEAAITSWRGRVRWLHGERFTNHKAARDLLRACAPSSVPDAYRDQKLPPLYRCEMQARPCRPQAMKIGRWNQ